MGGGWAHPLGSDELGRDVLSRLIMSIRLSLLIAFFGTIIATALGTALGFVAAHFRGRVEAAILVLIDFQASMPFLIIALAVLAFFGNNMILFVALMGLNSWERYARIARGLTIAANEQGYANAVRQLGASEPADLRHLHLLPNIASTLDRLHDHHLPRDDPARKRPVVPRAGCAAAAQLARQHGGLRPRIPDARAVDHAMPERGHRALDAVDQHRRRLVARPPRSHTALRVVMTDIASHRGGALLWPENSRTAFENTAKLPVEQVEFDVHPSRDGGLVVIHDDTLDRTTDASGPIAQRDWADPPG